MAVGQDAWREERAVLKTRGFNHIDLGTKDM
jgi:hypothetical protein